MILFTICLYFQSWEEIVHSSNEQIISVEKLKYQVNVIYYTTILEQKQPKCKLRVIYIVKKKKKQRKENVGYDI